MSPDWFVLIPLDCAHVSVLDHLVVSSLGSGVSLLSAKDKLIDPLSRSDSDVSRTDKSHRVSMN